MIRDISPYLYVDVHCNVQSCEGERRLACVSWSVDTVYGFKAGSLARTLIHSLTHSQEILYEPNTD